MISDLRQTPGLFACPDGRLARAAAAM